MFGPYVFQVFEGLCKDVMDWSDEGNSCGSQGGPVTVQGCNHKNVCDQEASVV
jgi:hypothetical protein